MNDSVKVVFVLELIDIIEEYDYHCLAKGFTKKTMINKRQELKQMRIFLQEKRGIKKLENIYVDDLKAYIRSKQKAGLQATSIISMHKMVSAFFNWCVKEEYLKENPMRKVERPKAHKKLLKGFTQEEVRDMINAFNSKTFIEARNKAIIATLADTGLRAMELRELPFDAVRETSIIVNGKGNKERIVFISPALKKVLIKYERLRKEYIEDNEVKENCYFLTYTLKGLTHVALDNIIKKAGKRAGIEGKRVSPHVFRHFYAVQCLTVGNIDIYSLSRLLGHGDIQITERYLHSMDDEQLSNKAIPNSPLMNLNK